MNPQLKWILLLKSVKTHIDIILFCLRIYNTQIAQVPH